MEISAFGSGSPKIVDDDPPHIFGKRYAEFGSLVLRPPLGFGIQCNLGAHIHDGTIMPSL
jgi:hypothetical protein